jgi:hypothetical protein
LSKRRSLFGTGSATLARDPEKWEPVFGNDHAQFKNLARDPEKWEPVFGNDHAQTKNLALDGDSTRNHPALRPVRARRQD